MIMTDRASHGQPKPRAGSSLDSIHRVTDLEFLVDSAALAQLFTDYEQLPPGMRAARVSEARAVIVRLDQTVEVKE